MTGETKVSGVTQPVKRGRGRPRKNPIPVIDVSADETLESMEINKLRNRAATVYKIPGAEELGRKELIEAIRNRSSNNQFAVAAGDSGGIPAGWAKIELFKDPSPRASNKAHYVRCNGTKFGIPFGKVVMVPIKIYEVLNNAIIKTTMEDTSTAANAKNRYTTVETHRFPFKLYGLTPGPDPRPDNAGRAARHSAREEFHAKFGFWPNKEQLQAAMIDNVVKIRRFKQLADKQKDEE